MIPEPNTNSSPIVWEIAVPSPLHRTFEYLPPIDDVDEPQAGSRVRVPFAGRVVVGVFLSKRPATFVKVAKLKHALANLDAAPLLERHQLSLLVWLSQYYLVPIGEALMLGFGAHERKGKDPWRPPLDHVSAVSNAIDPNTILSRAPKQLAALKLIEGGPVAVKTLDAQGVSKATLRALLKTPFVKKVASPLRQRHVDTTTLALNAEQQGVVATLLDDFSSFKTHLLEGVTGSGKTEIYIECLKAIIARQQQALVIVPEIGLTPQTQARFEKALGIGVQVIHSAVSDSERSQAWSMARSGEAPVVLGTRSSVFCSFQSLGLIIVDEEHDGSLRQQDHPRYSARDVAVKRGQICDCPVILGSATPSLESLENALTGRYRHHRLMQRPSGAALPTVKLIDTRGLALNAGLSDEALAAMEDTVKRGEQALLFLNKRGFARSVQCEDCGWTAECSQCDAVMAVHKNPAHLSCHHCLERRPPPYRCDNCNSIRLSSQGVGTEQLEALVNQRVTSVPVFRIDSDSVSSVSALQRVLTAVRETPSAILLGTQMLSKGHDFPRVTCVIIVDADGLLLSPDFRAEERLLQLLIQVSGRSGRAALPGTVFIQTKRPEHPLMHHIIDRPYSELAQSLLERRRSLFLPPHGALGLIRADSKSEREAIDFLTQVKAGLSQSPSLRVLGPIPTQMTRRAGLFRYQLVVHSQSRKAVHEQLRQATNLGSTLKLSRKLSWFVEIDPTETM